MNIETISFSDGSFYRGEVTGQLPHGQGKRSFSGGSNYEGAWNMGTQNGEGVRTLSNKDTINGTWRNGVLCGETLYYHYKSGNKMKVTFREDGTLDTDPVNTSTDFLLNYEKDGFAHFFQTLDDNGDYEQTSPQTMTLLKKLNTSLEVGGNDKKVIFCSSAAEVKYNWKFHPKTLCICSLDLSSHAVILAFCPWKENECAYFLDSNYTRHGLGKIKGIEDKFINLLEKNDLKMIPLPYHSTVPSHMNDRTFTKCINTREQILLNIHDIVKSNPNINTEGIMNTLIEQVKIDPKLYLFTNDIGNKYINVTGSNNEPLYNRSNVTLRGCNYSFREHAYGGQLRRTDLTRPSSLEDSSVLKVDTTESIFQNTNEPITDNPRTPITNQTHSINDIHVQTIPSITDNTHSHQIRRPKSSCCIC